MKKSDSDEELKFIVKELQEIVKIANIMMFFRLKFKIFKKIMKINLINNK